MTAEKTEQQAARNGMVRSPTIYADVIPEMSLGYPVSKLVFAVLSGDGQPQPSVTVCVPTLTLLEAAKNLLRLAKDTEDQLQQFGQQSFTQLHSMLTDVTIDGPAPNIVHNSLSKAEKT